MKKKWNEIIRSINASQNLLQSLWDMDEERWQKGLSGYIRKYRIKMGSVCTGCYCANKRKEVYKGSGRI